MTDYTELQRAAEAVKAMDYPWEHTILDGRLGKTSTQYARLAHPSNVLALIAENEALGRAYAIAGEREHELRVERETLRKAVAYAAEMFSKISSGDGSGHADLARAVLRIAGPAMSKEPSHG